MKRISAPENPAPAPAEEIMTVAALARYLRCHRSLIYRLLKNKQIPAFRVGSDWRFSRSAIHQWIARLHDSNPAVSKGRKSKVS